MRRALIVLRETKAIPLGEQEKAITEYARDKYTIVGKHTIRHGWEHHAFLGLIADLAEHKPDAVLVYNYYILGVNCRRLVRNINAVLSIAGELIEVYNGTRITREEWMKHRDFLVKLTNAPLPKKKAIDPELMRKAAFLLTFNLHEGQLIYNALADRKGLPQIKNYTALRNALVEEEMLTAESIEEIAEDLPRKTRLRIVGGEKRGEQGEQS